VLKVLTLLELLLRFTMASHIDVACNNLFPHNIQIHIVEHPPTWISNAIRHVRRPLIRRLVVFKYQFVRLNWLWIQRRSEIEHLISLLVNWLSDFDVSDVCALLSELEIRFVRAWPCFCCFVFLHNLIECKRVLRQNLDCRCHLLDRIVIGI
jgi:hypothetical protein